jgi:Golgi apparatus protein 1
MRTFYTSFLFTCKISKGCVEEVKKVMSLRAANINLMPEIQDTCAEDLAKYCSDINTNSKGEELRCLQANYKKLEGECQKALAEFTQEENKDIRLDQILMKACTPTIDEFCTDKKEQKNELLECLIEQKNNGKMDEKCRIGIEHHQLINLENVEFNLKFKKQCKEEIKDHCIQMKSKVEVIQCLSELVLNDTLLDKPQRIGPKCRRELRVELFQLNENIKLDPELEAACQTDVAQYCENVKTGKGQVLECLRSNEKRLSSACRERLFKRDKMNFVDAGTDFTLQTKCKNAIKLFCDTTDNGEDVLSCLRKHLLKPTIEPVCKQVVINRIMVQNKDIRLNPTLWKTCNREINSFCASQLAEIAGDLNNMDVDLNGRVVKCLKKNFVKNTLSGQCRVEIDQIMREAATVDYRLDPLLADACINEIEQLCSDKPNDKKEDCLRLAFHKSRISKSSLCFEVS